MSGLVVVVPCYNEERRLDPSAFCQFARDAAGIRFVFVNDGSTDGTARVLRGLETSDPESFAACALPQNMGKAEAVRQGFLTAFRSQPEYVAFWDADLATPLEIIPSFRDVLDRRPELLLVIGSRMRLLGHRLVRDPLRHLASRIFSHVASWLLGVRIHDTQCGAKMFRDSGGQIAFCRAILHRLDLRRGVVRPADEAARGEGPGPAEAVRL